jgi:uncharacterized protein
VRRELTPESDLDFLVRFEHGTAILERTALKQALSELLGRRVDFAHPDRLKPLIKETILAEAVSL